VELSQPNKASALAPSAITDRYRETLEDDDTDAPISFQVFGYLVLFVVIIYAGWIPSRLRLEDVRAAAIHYWPSPPSRQQEADKPNQPIPHNSQPGEQIATPQVMQSDPRPTSQLKYLCDQTEWTPGLWVHCFSFGNLDNEGKQSVAGGLNNIRSRVQTCLRVAIDAGAGFIVPMVQLRNETTYGPQSDEQPFL
jgi:hypothetical protein